MIHWGSWCVFWWNPNIPLFFNNMISVLWYKFIILSKELSVKTWSISSLIFTFFIFLILCLCFKIIFPTKLRWCLQINHSPLKANNGKGNVEKLLRKYFLFLSAYRLKIRSVKQTKKIIDNDFQFQIIYIFHERKNFMLIFQYFHRVFIKLTNAFCLRNIVRIIDHSSEINFFPKRHIELNKGSKINNTMQFIEVMMISRFIIHQAINLNSIAILFHETLVSWYRWYVVFNKLLTFYSKPVKREKKNY